MSAASARPGSRRAISTRPPPNMAPFSRLRRLTFSITCVRVMYVMSHPRRSQPHRGVDALITAAAADVAGHGIVDFCIGRFWVGGQQGSRLHDLTGLAEPALRPIQRPPRFLHPVVADRIKALDGGHRFAADVAQYDPARPYGLAVDMNGAGAA